MQTECRREESAEPDRSALAPAFTARRPWTGHETCCRVAQSVVQSAWGGLIRMLQACPAVVMGDGDEGGFEPCLGSQP